MKLGTRRTARGAGIAQWLEHRTRDWKVAGSNPCWNGGRIFFSRVDFLCWLLFRYPFHPRVTTVARKKSRSFCQKCRWQVTAKHAYTLRMWILLNRASALVTTCPQYVKWHLRTLSINSSEEQLKQFFFSTTGLHKVIRCLRIWWGFVLPEASLAATYMFLSFCFSLSSLFHSLSLTVCLSTCLSVSLPFLCLSVSYFSVSLSLSPQSFCLSLPLPSLLIGVQPQSQVRTRTLRSPDFKQSVAPINSQTRFEENPHLTGKTCIYRGKPAFWN